MIIGDNLSHSTHATGSTFLSSMHFQDRKVSIIPYHSTISRVTISNVVLLAATVMLVTTLCWRLYDGDTIFMLVIFPVLLILSLQRIGHQPLEVVTNINRLQYPSPISM